MSIEHNTEEGLFETEVDGFKAYLAYRPVDDRWLDYYSTYVPANLRGRGIAGRIVKVALEFASQEGYRIRPTCSFVADFVERHPEYKALVKHSDS